MVTQQNLVPVIMSGGAGTRLWPASRSDRPKQFLPLVTDHSMVQATLDRLAPLNAAPPLVVANAAHADLVDTELRTAGIDSGRMIFEPLGRNTAPAAAVAAIELSKSGDDPLMLLLPADHVIEDIAAFVTATDSACQLARAGNLVTFGVVPTHPETGYGYIRAGAAINDAGFRVAAFVEKPDADTALSYLASGGYLWNSGMFVFRCSDYLSALRKHAPEILEGCVRTMAASQYDRGLRLDADEFASTPAESIDYAVMEHTAKAAVVPLDAGWSDVGSWAALWEASAHDGDGNTIIGDVVATGATNSYIRSEHRLVTVAGLDNIVVVETPDSVLVTTVTNSQAVKTIVDILKEQGRDEASRTTDTG